MCQLCFTCSSDGFLQIQVNLNPACFLEASHCTTTQDAEHNSPSPFLFSLLCLPQLLEQRACQNSLPSNGKAKIKETQIPNLALTCMLVTMTRNLPCRKWGTLDSTKQIPTKKYTICYWYNYHQKRNPETECWYIIWNYHPYFSDLLHQVEKEIAPLNTSP